MTSHEIPYGEQKASTTLYVTSALDGESVINATPLYLYPWDETGYPLRRRLFGTQCRSVRV